MPHLYLLCGLAFSGKSTLGARLAERTGATIVSLDEINAERGLDGGAGIPDAEWLRTHHEALARLDALLAAGRSVVLDDTNCFRFLRDAYREVAARHQVSATVVVLDVPLDVVRARMRENERSGARAAVTDAVLEELVAKFEWPDEDEIVVTYRRGDAGEPGHPRGL